MSRLDEVMNKINKSIGADIVQRGTERTRYKKIPFTSPKLNYMTYGGIARGKVLEIFGGENGGKSTLSIDLCGNAQKIFEQEYEEKINDYKQRYEELINGGKAKEKQAAKLLVEMEEVEESGPQVVAYFDLENTFDEVWASKLGVNTSKLLLIRPENQTAEQVLQIALDLVDSGGVGLLVLDSIPKLVPQQIFDESLEKKNMGGVAKILTDFCNKVTPKLTVNDCTLVGLNQLRENISAMSYGPTTTTSGGRSWRHECSMRIQVRKGDYIDAKFNSIPRKSANPHGNIIEVTIEKTKVCRPDRKNGQCVLNYYDGFSKEYDLVQLALEYGYVVASGSWFSFVNPETGEVLVDDDNKPMKYQGMSKVIQTLIDNTELFAELNSMLEEEFNEEE